MVLSCTVANAHSLLGLRMFFEPLLEEPLFLFMFLLRVPRRVPFVIPDLNETVWVEDSAKLGSAAQEKN